MHDLLFRFFTRLTKDAVMNTLSFKLGDDNSIPSETELDLMADNLFGFYFEQICPINERLKKMDEENRIL